MSNDDGYHIQMGDGGPKAVNGVISDEYFIIEGYLKAIGKFVVTSNGEPEQ